MESASYTHGGSHRALTTIHGRPTTLQSATDTLTASLRLVVIILAVLSVVCGALWLLLRRTRIRLRVSNGSDRSAELLILESDISIEMVGEDGQGSILDFEDVVGRGSFETVLSSVSATKIAFDLEKLPVMMRGEISERRGRGRLRCDTTASYNLDQVAISTGPLSGSTQAEKSSVRAIYRFEGLQVSTPGVSPTWFRKADN